MVALSYSKCQHLIKDADILLFKCGKFPCFGWWISKYTRSPYSHVAMAHRVEDEILCLEFREFKGSREYPLINYINEGCKIDVFRCVSSINYPEIMLYPSIQVYDTYHRLSNNIKNKIIHTAKSLMNKPYSWWTIWTLAKYFIPFIRLRQPICKNGEVNPSDFVCSTLISYSYRVNFLDPVPFLADNQTTPGDLARSPLFYKLFEILPD